MVRLGQLFCNAAYGALVMGGDRDAREFADRAAPIVRDLDNPGTWMVLCGNTGLAALLTGDTDAARDCLPRGARALPPARRPADRRRRPPRACGRRRRRRRPQPCRAAARRRGGAWLRPAAGRRRGEARGGVLRDRPHAPRSRRMGHRRPRRGSAELRRRDRLRVGSTARAVGARSSPRRNRR